MTRHITERCFFKICIYSFFQYMWLHVCLILKCYSILTSWPSYTIFVYIEKILKLMIHWLTEALRFVLGIGLLQMKSNLSNWALMVLSLSVTTMVWGRTVPTCKLWEKRIGKRVFNFKHTNFQDKQIFWCVLENFRIFKLFFTNLENMSSVIL